MPSKMTDIFSMNLKGFGLKMEGHDMLPTPTHSILVGTDMVFFAFSTTNSVKIFNQMLDKATI